MKELSFGLAAILVKLPRNDPDRGLSGKLGCLHPRHSVGLCAHFGGKQLPRRNTQQVQEALLFGHCQSLDIGPSHTLTLLISCICRCRFVGITILLCLFFFFSFIIIFFFFLPQSGDKTSVLTNKFYNFKDTTDRVPFVVLLVREFRHLRAI